MGVLTYEEAIAHSAVGLVRASGVRADLRESSPYEPTWISVSKPRGAAGLLERPTETCLTVSLSRVHEVYQSLDIIEKVMEGLP